jgi:hypothetical protein
MRKKNTVKLYYAVVQNGLIIIIISPGPFTSTRDKPFLDWLLYPYGTVQAQDRV